MKLEVKPVGNIKAVEEKPAPESWLNLFRDFTQETTAHGVRYTGQRTHWIRRSDCFVTDSIRSNNRQFKHQTLFAMQTQTQRNLIVKANQMYRICHTLISHWPKNLGYIGLGLSLCSNLRLVLKLSDVQTRTHRQQTGFSAGPSKLTHCSFFHENCDKPEELKFLCLGTGFCYSISAGLSIIFVKHKTTTNRKLHDRFTPSFFDGPRQRNFLFWESYIFGPSKMKLAHLCIRTLFSKSPFFLLFIYLFLNT